MPLGTGLVVNYGGVKAAKVIKQGQVEGGVAKTSQQGGKVRGENSFFTDANYTKKVLGQIKSQDFHAYPANVAALEKMSTVTVM